MIQIDSRKKKPETLLRQYPEAYLIDVTAMPQTYGNSSAISIPSTTFQPLSALR